MDQKVFPADKKLADDQIIGSGPYKLSQYKAGQQAVLELNPNYTGPNQGKAPQVFVKYYTEPSALKLAVQNGEVDVAWRSLAPTDVASLKKDSNVTVATGKGSEIRYWVWYLNECRRQAAGHPPGRGPDHRPRRDRQERLRRHRRPAVLDRPAGLRRRRRSPSRRRTARPTWPRPSRSCRRPASGRRSTSPSAGRPPTTARAPRTRPTRSSASWRPAGCSRSPSKSTEWEQYQTIYKQGAYDLFILGWFPDYPDADDYLSPFLVDGGFFRTATRTRRRTSWSPRSRAPSDQAKRQQIFGQLQDIAAKDVPFIPSWVGQNTAVYGKGMSGVESTLDPSFIFRFWLVTKNG